jgi:iron complex outermembrane receptor protein
MRIATLIIVFLLSLSVAHAQDGATVYGKILKGDKPFEGATVRLLRAKDSATVKFSASGREGVFQFDNLAAGNYRVAVTAVASQSFLSGVVTVRPGQKTELPAIRLTDVTNGLAGVTVTAKRPLVEQKIDRTIINVEASISNVGSSAMEVLEKAPGVTVDSDGNISLKGKQGVLVMVDGRPTQLGGADLANLLRSMSYSQLDQIEIMTNPPAKYDASGNSGVINIRTKKIITAGVNGSVNLAYSQGRYPKTNEGFNFNYRKDKLNLFTNVSHNYQKRFSTLNIDRNIYNDAGMLTSIFNQQADRVLAGNAYSAKFGVDFFASKKTTFGAVVNLNARSLAADNPNRTYIYNAAKTLQSITRAGVNNEMDWTSTAVNFNFRRLLDSKGSEMTSDIDFASHRMDYDLFMVNSYTDAAGNFDKKADTLTGLLPQNIDVYSARVDYLRPVKKKGKLEAGIKSSIVRTDNNANYDSIQQGAVVHDFSRSNHFVYEENINAAYANLSTPLSKKLTAQFGLRLENTIANGKQLTTGQNFHRSYTQLFPTAYFQYQANEKNNFGANFGRRVSRPSYQSLNPFIRFIDRYTFSQGNPALKPSVSSSIELSHTWKSRITTTANYTHIKDVIQSIIQQKGEEAYNMPANVSTLNQLGIAVTANTPLTKWWTSNLSVNVYRDNIKGFVNSTPLSVQGTTFLLNGTQQFKITKTFSAELSGTYRRGGLEGVMRVQPVGQLSAGLSQQILKGKGSLRLAVRDIFRTQKMNGTTRYSNVDVQVRQVSETRYATLSVTYSFSKGKKIAPVKRTQGSANEEQSRIGQ